MVTTQIQVDVGIFKRLIILKMKQTVMRMYHDGEQTTELMSGLN